MMICLWGREAKQRPGTLSQGGGGGGGGQIKIRSMMERVRTAWRYKSGAALILMVAKGNNNNNMYWIIMSTVCE